MHWNGTIINEQEYIKWTRYFGKGHSFTTFQLFDIGIECILKLWLFSASFNFCLWWKLQSNEKTTDLPEVIGKRWSHIEDTALPTGNRTYKREWCKARITCNFDTMPSTTWSCYLHVKRQITILHVQCSVYHQSCIHSTFYIPNNLFKIKMPKCSVYWQK